METHHDSFGPPNQEDCFSTFQSAVENSPGVVNERSEDEGRKEGLLFLKKKKQKDFYPLRKKRCNRRFTKK